MHIACPGFFSSTLNPFADAATLFAAKSLPMTAISIRFWIERTAAMIHVFIYTNNRGGVGNSTSATNIALGITQVPKRANASNCRALLIATESQGHA